MNIKLVGKNKYLTVGLLFVLLGAVYPVISGNVLLFQFPAHLRTIELGTWYWNAWETGWHNYTITIPEHSGHVTFTATVIGWSNGTSYTNYPWFVDVYLDDVKVAWARYTTAKLTYFDSNLPAGDYVLAITCSAKDNPVAVKYTLSYDPPPFEKTVLLKTFDAVSTPGDPVGEPFTAYWSSGDFQITVPEYQTRCGYIRMESISINGLHRTVRMIVDGHSTGTLLVSPNDQNVYLLYDDPLAGTHTMSLNFCLTPYYETNDIGQITSMSNWHGTVNVFFDYMPTTAPIVAPPTTPADPTLPGPPAIIPSPPTDGNVPPLAIQPGGTEGTDYMQWIFYAIGAVMIFLGFRKGGLKL